MSVAFAIQKIKNETIGKEIRNKAIDRALKYFGNGTDFKSMEAFCNPIFDNLLIKSDGQTQYAATDMLNAGDLFGVQAKAPECSTFNNTASMATCAQSWLTQAVGLETAGIFAYSVTFKHNGNCAIRAQTPKKTLLLADIYGNDFELEE